MRGFPPPVFFGFPSVVLDLASDQSNAHYIMVLLSERALVWSVLISQWLLSYDDSMSKMKGAFDYPDPCLNAAKRLLSILQGSRGVADFAVEFRTLPVDSK